VYAFLVYKEYMCAIWDMTRKMRNTRCLVRELLLMLEIPRIARENCAFASKTRDILQNTRFLVRRTN